MEGPRSIVLPPGFPVGGISARISHQALPASNRRAPSVNPPAGPEKERPGHFLQSLTGLRSEILAHQVELFQQPTLLSGQSGGCFHMNPDDLIPSGAAARSGQTLALKAERASGLGPRRNFQGGRTGKGGDVNLRAQGRV